MTTTINASNSGSGGLVQTADASGILALQTAGTTAVTFDASQNATFAGTIKSTGKGMVENYDYLVPTTGFSYTFSTYNVLIMNPAGTLATGTITMPASPSDGMVVTFSSTQQITALTVAANAGQTIYNAVLVFAAGLSMSYIYRAASTSWFAFTTALTPKAISSISQFTTSVSYLIVAGGGGGGGAAISGYNGSGGGAGGMLTGTTTITGATTYSFVIGAGGGGGGNSSPGANGSNSTAFGLTAIGGGNGATVTNTGGNGGSGGGGGAQGGGGAGGSGTSGQGNNGATGTGGGAGAAAVAGSAGGIGLQSSITGTAAYYAGGGGYANTAGGLGGGGAGGTPSSTGTAGTANTGGGGGGGYPAGGLQAGGAGGSGIVIVSVPTALYSGTTTGSPIVITSGSNTVIIFTGSGSYTA